MIKVDIKNKKHYVLNHIEVQDVFQLISWVDIKFNILIPLMKIWFYFAKWIRFFFIYSNIFFHSFFEFTLKLKIFCYYLSLDYVMCLVKFKTNLSPKPDCIFSLVSEFFLFAIFCLSSDSELSSWFIRFSFQISICLALRSYLDLVLRIFFSWLRCIHSFVCSLNKI